MNRIRLRKDLIMEAKIRAVLEELRKALQSDGGDLEIIAIEGKNVKVSLRGACGCCPHAMATLKDYVEANLRETVDSEITVERV